MLQKKGIDISFAQGLDTKTDPKRVEIGKFRRLQNQVFNKGGLLQKRNGYARLANLPDDTYAYLTTLRGNLTAVGPTIAAYNDSNAAWVSRGTMQPMALSTLPLIRNNLNQIQVDAAVAPNGLVCTVYSESNGSTTTVKYAIANVVTGQNIVAPTAIPVASGTVTGGARVFVFNTSFVLIFTNVITAVSHLQYVRISINNPTSVGANTDIAAAYIPSQRLAWDAFATSSGIFIAYNTTTGGQAIKVTKITTTFTVVTAVTFSAEIATIVTVTVDETVPSQIVYVSYYDDASKNAYTLAVDGSLNTAFAPVLISMVPTILNMASAAQNGNVYVYTEIQNAYSFNALLPTNFISAKRVSQAGSGPVQTEPIRSVGLASKAFIVDGSIYFLAAYDSLYQRTYFLVAGTSLSTSPVIVAKVAYGNGGGYLARGLPGVTVDGATAYIGYLIKDLIQAVNKGTDLETGTQTAGIYSQTGVNLASFDFSTDNIDSAEIAGDLHLSGGFLWMYDGYLPVEHNFFLWPDMDTSLPTAAATWSAAGGSIVAQPDGATNANAYYYQVTYEWTDNVGNAYRSAPSIPIPVTTTGNGSSGSITVNVPTLRLTYKTANPIKIVIYRWSIVQQSYYQVTSITSPLLNSTTADQVAFVDTLADASILGNNLLYTTGGVLENVNAPATNLMTLFDTRLWIVDAENPDNLWFSKPVIQSVPVEMSDNLTMYISPTAGAQGPTGPMRSISVLDDKLVLFKKNAIYYVNGTGPDITGANSQYSEPTFITATVGCDNQNSIVFQPAGLMFQSDKGIWLLGRDLQTSYIGAPVEEFNDARVLSAQNIPSTNQVRFILDSGVTLVYDYYYNQWGTFVNVPAVSATIFEGMHTFINDSGLAFQENPGSYVDGSLPVLMGFTTGPIRLGDLQAYQRAYFFYLLGEYLSPHKLFVQVAYDYSNSPSHGVVISPQNYSTPFGSGDSQSPFGQGNPFGGPSHSEDWRVFLSQQRCQAFSISLDEIFDPSEGAEPGAGFSLSGINAVCGFKSPFRPQAAAKTVGMG